MTLSVEELRLLEYAELLCLRLRDDELGGKHDDAYWRGADACAEAIRNYTREMRTHE